MGERFSDKQYHEELEPEMIQSINKYGGFYISSYLVSDEKYKIVSKKGKLPWVNIKQGHAERLAKQYLPEHSNCVSCLPCGAAYDSLFEWIMEAGEKNIYEVVCDSSQWGNYRNTKKSPKELTRTGSNNNWRVFGIYDLAGNCNEWSTEKYGKDEVVMRTGDYFRSGRKYPAAKRNTDKPDNDINDAGFRIMLYLKP